MRIAIIFSSIFTLTACASHFAYKAPASSALRSATSSKCVILPALDATQGKYEIGWPCWQASFKPKDVQADATKVAHTVVEGAKLCSSVEDIQFDPADWTDSRRETLHKRGYDVGARLVLDRMTIDGAPNWWVFINPISLLFVLGLPVINGHDTNTITAHLDLVDLSSGKILYTFNKEVAKVRDSVWTGYLNGSQLSDGIEPAWREWGQQAVAALQSDGAVALQGGGSSPSGGAVSAAYSQPSGPSNSATAATRIALRGKLAVLDLRNYTKELTPENVQYFTDVVRQATLKLEPQLDVMTRENLLVLLQSTGRRLEECEGECEVDTGRRIGADDIVSGEIQKLGSRFKLTLRLHDTHGGRLLSSAIGGGKSVEELDDAASKAAQQLFTTP